MPSVAQRYPSGQGSHFGFVLPLFGPWEPAGQLEHGPPEPVAVEKVPSGQRSGAEDPAGQNVPAGHSSQTSGDAACSIELIVPAGHGLQVEASVARSEPLYVPAAHAVQLFAPPVEKVPGKQSNGSELAAGQAVPASHGLQVARDIARVAAEYVPSGQFSIEVVVGQKCPAAQTKQASADVAPISCCVVPIGQFLGDLDPSVQ